MRYHLNIVVVLLVALIIVCSIGMRLPGVGIPTEQSSLFDPVRRAMGEMSGLAPNTAEQGLRLPLHQWAGIVLIIMAMVFYIRGSLAGRFLLCLALGYFYFNESMALQTSLTAFGRNSAIDCAKKME